MIVVGCASVLIAKTPEQRAYAAISEYTIVAEAAADYSMSSAASQTVVLRMIEIHDKAEPVINQIYDVLLDRVYDRDWDPAATHKTLTTIEREDREALWSALVTLN